MDKKESLAFLDSLIEKTKAMTSEEFAERERLLGVDKVVYNPADYDPPDCTRPDDTECHAHCGKKCYNGFLCQIEGDAK